MKFKIALKCKKRKKFVREEKCSMEIKNKKKGHYFPKTKLKLNLKSNNQSSFQFNFSNYDDKKTKNNKRKVKHDFNCVFSSTNKKRSDD